MKEENRYDKLEDSVNMVENSQKRENELTDAKLIYSSEEGKVFAKPLFSRELQLNEETEEKEQGRTR